MRYLTFALVFSLSRLLLIDARPIFFDSQEYVNLLSQPDFLSALALGHAPPHVGYIFLFWPIYHIFHSFAAVLVFQSLLALAAIFAFIATIKIIVRSTRVAFLAGVIAALLPLFWIASASFMMEISYTAFFVFSLYFLVRRRLILSALFFSLAVITHPLVVFLVFLILYLISNLKLKISNFLIPLAVIYSSLSCLNILNIAYISHTSFWAEFLRMYFSKFHEHAVLSFSLTGLLIFLRNFLIPLIFNNSLLLVLLVPFALFGLKSSRYFWIALFWILPAAFVNQWWDSLLNGRHALLAGFGLSFAASLLLSRHRLYKSIFLVYLLAFSVPAVSLLKGNIPYLQEAQAVALLPKNSLLIVSHFAKPQDEAAFPGVLLAVNFPLTPTSEIKKAIDIALQEKRPVFITSTAISEPYGLYSGPYLHNLSLSYLHPFELNAILPGYTLQLIKTINAKDNLFISQIVSTASANLPNPGYPLVPNLSKSPRLINSGDILMQQFYKLHPF